MAEAGFIALSPQPDELNQLSMAREGDLAATPFWRLLLALALNERSATLELRRGPLEKKIVLEDGVPIDCFSNVATETLGRYMVSNGKLSESAYQVTFSNAIGRRVSFEEALAERGDVAPSEIFRLLQQNLGRKLLDVFTWRNGSFHISREIPDVESPLPVKVPQLIFTGLYKFEPQERVDDLIASLGERVLRLADAPLFEVNELRIARQQAPVLKALQSGTTFASLQSSTAIAPDDLGRIVYAFAALGIVSVAEASTSPAKQIEKRAAPAVPFLELDVDESDTALPERERQRRAMPPAAAPPAAAPPLSSDELLGTYLSFRRKDSFELLDVAEDAAISGINRAYVAFADRFLPIRYEGSGEGMREKAQEIFLAGARAYAELADQARRTSLVEKRVKQREEPKEAPAPPPATPVKTVDPEDLHRQGRALADAGKLREALSYFDMAADCDAQNGTYAAELAWTRYQLMISTAALTLKTLRNAMRIDPRAGAAFLYTGKIHAILGNKLEAEGYLRKAASLMPRDRRPGEALKALLGK